jgi:hypothetical protein
MEYVNTIIYLDDLIMPTNNIYKDHLLKLEMVLTRLSTGMRVNVLQSSNLSSLQNKKKYLGCWNTRKGAQSVRNNVEMNFILDINAPKAKKEKRHGHIFVESTIIATCGFSEVSF